MMYSHGDILYIKDKYLGSKLNKMSTTHIEWAKNKEAVYTNSRSWRVKSPEDTKPFASDIAIAGASWTIGVGVNYEESFVGHLEEKLKIKIPLLSVGSSSFVQLMRFVETEIHIIKPKIIMISYTSCLVDRCLKDRDTPVHYRPVLKRKQKTRELDIVKANTPPDFLSKHYVSIERKLRNKHHIKNPPNSEKTFATFEYPLWARFYLSSLAFVGKIYHGYPMSLLKNKLGLKSHERIKCDSKESREEILRYCLNHLLKCCKQYNTKVVLHHLYEYSGNTPHVELDYNILTSLSKELGFSYYDWKAMEKNFKDFLTFQGLTIEDHVGAVTWPDHNHPDKNGHRLIADSIYPILKDELNRLSL